MTTRRRPPAPAAEAVAPQLLTTAQVAERTGLSQDSIERLIARGDLEAISVHVEGKRAKLRVSEAALNAFYRARAVS